MPDRSQEPAAPASKNRRPRPLVAGLVGVSFARPLRERDLSGRRHEL